MKPDLRVSSTVAELNHAAAHHLLGIAGRAVAERGRFTLVLAGGSTPKGLYALLADDPQMRATMPWSKTHFFWGDERCVPPDHADSNYRMAQEAMLAKAPVVAGNIHRIKAEVPDAAEQYAQTIKRMFDLMPGQFPRFDLVLLGMGPDGHTASLFPHTTALEENQKTVVSNFVPKLSANRITLTAPTINHAAQVAFLIAGADKAPALKAVTQGAANPGEYPAQLVRPVAGEMVWLVDQSAAAGLTSL
jgi:6-phosphogluconolactonase